jgi:hypothetical protein
MLKRQVAELEDRVDQRTLDYYETFNRQLATLSDKLGLTDDERVSVYKHDGKAFIMLGRCAANPRFLKAGRKVYPEDEGCISIAWEHGEAFLDGLPDPDANLDAYAEAQKKARIKKGTARMFKMRSRSYAAFAITDAASGKRIAVVVFESTRPDSLQRLQQSFSALERRGLAHFIERMSTEEPTPTYAQEEGY